MSVHPSENCSPCSDPSFLEHMKRIQFISWFPLSLTTSSFSKGSNMFLSISVIYVVVNLVQKWLTVILSGRNTTDTFFNVIAIIMTISYCSIPAIYIITALQKKSRFEEVTKQFLTVLKTLGLWRYEMFLSCKVAMGIWGVGILVNFSVNIVSVWFSKRYVTVIDDVAGIVYSSYLVAWELQFFYTVRTIEACFHRLTQSLITNKTNMKLFFQLYNRLIEIAAETNEFYDFCISVLLLLFLLNFIDLSAVVLAGKGSVYGKSVVYIDASIIAAMLMCILRNCHAASNQADKSNEALLRYIVHHKRLEHHENQLLLIHLCTGQKLVFRACKSFTINYNLGISMVAAYLTYTIVILQMSKSSSPSSCLNATNSTLTNGG